MMSMIGFDDRLACAAPQALSLVSLLPLCRWRTLVFIVAAGGRFVAAEGAVFLGALVHLAEGAVVASDFTVSASTAQVACFGAIADDVATSFRTEEAATGARRTAKGATWAITA